MDTTYFYFEMHEFFHGKQLSQRKTEKNKDISVMKRKNDKFSNTGEKNKKS